MGKGMPAALLMATVRAAVRSVAADRSPAEAVDAVSRAIANDLDRTASFVTLFHGNLTPDTGELEWVDAGHGLVVLLGPDGTLASITQTDLPVGVIEESSATTCRRTIAPGETVIICSDGLADTVEDIADVRALRESAHQTAESMIAHLVVAARDRGANEDDRTAIVIKRGGVSG
jgi:serine phosphatase RsbU (regulator of sigma subunit)